MLNKKSLLSFILSFLGLVIPFILVKFNGEIFIVGLLFALFFSILGIIISFKAVSEIQKSKEIGKSLVIIASICSIIAIFRLILLATALTMPTMEPWVTIISTQGYLQ